MIIQRAHNWVALVVLLMLPAAMQAQFTYTTNADNTITITRYTGSGGAVTIPDNINSMAVTSIGDDAFWFHTSLTSVTIPDSVISIGYGAFAACDSLANVTIGSGVTSIEGTAFMDGTSLTALHFSGNAPSLGGSVFLGTDHATVYYLPGTSGWGATFGGRPTALWRTPPEPSTLSASTITRTGATLNGTVNPKGWQTSAWFQWGATTNYGNLTPVTGLGSGTTALALSAPLAGLSSGVTYHFRTAATNENGIAYGSDQSFTTRDLPLVSTLPATSVSTHSATLNGTVNPKGWPTTAWFEWGTTTDYGKLTLVADLGSGTNALPLSAPLAGLSPGVTYHFRTAATNAYGIAYGSDQSFTTVTLPPEVGTLSATAVTTTSATINGTVNPNGSPTAAWFEWGATANYGNLTPVADLGSGPNALPLSAPLAGLNPGVTYHFRITATNDSGIAYGSDQSFTTWGPPLVSTLPATNVSTNSATLNGTINPKGRPTAGWFEWGATADYGNLTPMADLGSGTNALPLSAALPALAPGVTFHFRITATNEYGIAYGIDETFSTLGPPLVSALPPTIVSANSAVLNGSINPNGFPTGAWFQWGTATNYGNETTATGMGSGTNALPLSAALAGLTSGITYHFRVAATNGFGLVYSGDQSFNTAAVTYYVSSGSTNPTPPYGSWATAATNIQDAVDEATVAGALVMVSDGVYPGGLAVSKPLTLLSVNGPEFTTINGHAAFGVNCVSLADGASLTGFTLTNGYGYDAPGGGVSCTSTNAFLTNCIIVGNYPGGANGGTLYSCTLSGNSTGPGAADSILYNCTLTGNFSGAASASTLYNCTLTGNSSSGMVGGAISSTLYNCTLTQNDGFNGGGVNSCTLYNCRLIGNTSYHGGGALNCTLYNCTLSGNSAWGIGGAAYGSTLYNCTLTGNSVGAYASTLFNCIAYSNTNGNYDPSSKLSYCATTPLPINGVGNITSNPSFADAANGNLRLQSNSPCINAGNNAYVTTASDLDGNPRIVSGTVDMGAYEYQGTGYTLTIDIVGSGTVRRDPALNIYPAGASVTLTATPAAGWVFTGWSGDVTGAANPVSVTMNRNLSLAATFAGSNLPAATHYVSLGSTNPTPPYTNWVTAATNIQDALNAAAANDVVLVTNGVFAGGIRVTNPLTLLSVNGPQFTVINGGGGTNCVSLTNSASLTGFTLTNGVETATPGGGVLCASTNAFLTNCIIVGNYSGYGGGAYGGTLYNCTLANNMGSGAYGSTLYNCTLSANYGWINSAGGAANSTLYNCTLSGNSGGGAYGCTLYNCIAYSNTAGGNYDSTSTLNYCCTTPLPTIGVGNIISDPLFVDSANGNLRLQSNSPCINAGNNAYVTTATDLDGRPRIVGGTVDVGAYEFQPGPTATHYVSSGSTNPTPPYTNWITAATTIPQAVAAAFAGDAVVVTNGVYAGGVAVTKPLTLLSVNGPQATVINGGGANPCISLIHGASLTGFTLTNGYGTSSGAGVSCTSTNALLTNCIIVGNTAVGGGLYGDNLGGGVHGGTLYNCTLANNQGSGADGSTLYNCTLTQNNGGGTSGGCTLYNCTLIGNTANRGGGADSCTLYNCTLSGNLSRGGFGGGACLSTLYNCTLTGNNSQFAGGGAGYSTLFNCIVYSNTAGGNYDSVSTLNYCCTTPLPTNGVGNITTNPLFVDSASGNLRLQSNSPCINAGNNAYVTTATDLDGRPRIVGGTADMGAYEFQPGVSGAFIGWLQQYGQPTDGSADYADSDHDGLNNWQEWVCGTNPTNALSALRMVLALPTGTTTTVTWQSVAGVSYFLQRSTNLAAPFTLLATNILGQAGTTSYGDTNAAGAGPSFYRVGVQVP